MSQSYTLFPVRFSAAPQAMIAFLEALGLRKSMDTGDDTYAVFDGESGRVAVRGIEESGSRWTSGDTALNFSVEDVRRASATLTESGLESTVWDEAYGPQGILSTGDGRAIGLYEDSQQDLGGDYRVHEQNIAASLEVVAVWYSHDFAADAAFFAHVGFEPFGSLDDLWWCDLRAGRRIGGVIGLHGTGPTAAAATAGEHEESAAGSEEPEEPDQPDEFGPPALVRLGFETAEPLDALASRLAAAGYDATATEDDAGTKVVVVDPDGQHLEVHPSI